jgi:hypothetical protein
MPNFKEFDRKQARNPRGPSVTLTSRGAISFSAEAWDQLGSPEAVTLLFDEGERIVGFRPARRGERNAYPFRPNGSVRTVMATAFCGHIGVKNTGEPSELVTSSRAGTGASAASRSTEASGV